MWEKTKISASVNSPSLKLWAGEGRVQDEGRKKEREGGEKVW